MDRIIGYREIFRLYSPVQRKTDFPKADWRFLVHSARNLAGAFATTHAYGHVIGDVNQGNIVISADALVKFIDCDSFQVTVNGRRYLCEVGVGHFTPPELQGRQFRGLVRTPNHDNFGLAILCFHLLFVGRHPFAGRFLGPRDMPIEQAIREFRFAFGRQAASYQMESPPHVLKLANTSTRIAELFEQAFSEEAARQGTRPTGADWAGALDELEMQLRACSRYPGHKFHNSLSRCPWCEIEGSGGPDFFISVTAPLRLASGFDVQSVWAAIVAVAAPRAGREPPQLSPRAGITGTAIPATLKRTRLLRRLAGWSTLGVVTSLMTGIAPPGVFIIAVALGLVWLGLRSNHAYEEERSRRTKAVQLAKQNLTEVEERWRHEVGPVSTALHDRKRELERRKDEYQGLGTAYQRDRAGLNASREAAQRRRFLEQYSLQRHHIPDIGPGLKATLASYGVETAADINPRAIMAVPGFGPARTRKLLSWRANFEQLFRFDSTRGVDPSDLAALNQKYEAKRQELERVLRAAPQELRRLGAVADQKASSLLGELQRLTDAAEQARADAVLV
jgi:DNA-binding helix-hairpin-helix protein with protein kinase domain